ncbi:peptidase M3 family protein, partial [Vibrio parahaemolyticus VP2007-007]
ACSTSRFTPNMTQKWVRVCWKPWQK